MAYNPYGMYSNPQGFDYNTMRNQLAQLQQMQQQMSNSPMPNLNNNNNNQYYSAQPNVIQSGMFVVVESIEDMEKYPAPMNGDPVLIFIKGKSVYYSKKMANGSTSCQPYSSNVINNAPIEKSKETVAENDSENAIIKMLNGLSERLEKLENREVNSNVQYNASDRQCSTSGKNNNKSQTSD